MKKIVSPLTLCFLVASCGYQNDTPTIEATSTFCDGTCNVVADCANPNNECVTPTCIGGMCGTAPLAVGSPISTQTAGDCQKLECDGAGSTQSVADNADLPNDGNVCTTDTCVVGSPTFNNSIVGTFCGTNLICDGNGACVACVSDTDCPIPMNECLVRICTNNACGTANTLVGTVIANQTANDCQLLECDGNGSVISVIDNTDVPNDNNVCTNDLCTNGTPSNPFVLAETSCGAGLVCDGNGNCVSCIIANDCPGIDNECQTRTCLNEVCGFSYTTSGTLTSSQTSFDCKKNICDGAGQTVSQNDNTDIPVDGNQCTSDICTNGTPTNPNAAQGTVCNQNGGSVCDGNGNCVANVSNPVLIAWEDFSYAIGTNLNSQVCPAGTCGGWQTAARTSGSVCDATQNSLGNTGPNWLLGPNANASKIVAAPAVLPAGLTNVGNFVSLDDRLENNRLFRSINTASGSPAAQANAALIAAGAIGLFGTQLDLAGNPFLEHGVIWFTFVGSEVSTDTTSNYCGGHFYRGLGPNSCLPGKPNEVLQFGTPNYINNWGFFRTTQGNSLLGPSNWQSAVVMNTVYHEFTLKIELGVNDTVCSSPDNSVTSSGVSSPQTVTCPACPSGTHCNAAVTAWLDATPDGNGDPTQSPNVTRKVISNLANVSGVVGGFSTLELGCTGPSSSSQANNLLVGHLGLAADDITHHGGFKKSRLE